MESLSNNPLTKISSLKSISSFKSIKVYFLHFYPTLESKHLTSLKKESVYIWTESVQFSRLVVSNSGWPHGLQHARLPCPSPLLELAQTQVHRVSDAIQPSHPLLSPSPAFNLSSIRVFSNESVLYSQVDKTLEFQLQSFHWIFRIDFLWN